MHGRLKVKDSAEKAAEKALEREKKSKKYLAGIQSLFDQRKRGYQHLEALQFSAALLNVNPDALTLWNVRREVLLQLRDVYEENIVKEVQSLPEETSSVGGVPEVVVESEAAAVSRSAASWLDLISAELSVISSCLQANPKSYGAWHHRLWLMKQLCCAASVEEACAAWKKELALCDLFLKKDERNFHCWDYRRAVVECSGVDAAQELQFSLSLIERNFSNFSAWHYRSKLLPRLYPASSLSPLPVDKEIFDQELQRVVEAVFTDPGDQSPWFFLRWLLHQQPRQPQVVQVAVYRPPSNAGAVRVACTLTSAAHSDVLHASLTLPSCAQPVWRSASGRPRDCVWFAEVKNIPNSEFEVEVSGTAHSVAVGGDSCSSITVTRSLSHQHASLVPKILEQLRQECDLLHEIDADNKWVLLSLVELLCALGGEEELARAIKILEHLCSVDPLRTGYYSDRRSSLMLNEAVARHLKKAPALEAEAEFDCSGLGLSRIAHPHLLACTPRIDLSNNRITSLVGVTQLLACSTLILDGNTIEDLMPLGRLAGLRVLSLAGCGLSNSGVLTPVASLPVLRSLNLKCNEFSEETVLHVREICAHIGSLDV